MTNNISIAIIGYGRMGREIEKAAIAKGYEIVARIDPIVTGEDFDSPALSKADVAIEFTTPEVAVNNYFKCFELNIPVVSGTTGWLDEWEKVKARCEAEGQAFFYAPNFSVGVNLFFRLNQILAEMMNTQPTYRAEMEEIHHTGKKDAPSGTAIRLAEDILVRNDQLAKWENSASEEKNVLPVISKRIEGVPGTHTVYYKSAIDDIEIKHTAHSRKGFASGAYQAAKWLHGRKGVFGMEDMLADIFKQSK